MEVTFKYVKQNLNIMAEW